MLGITKLSGASYAELTRCANYPDERGGEYQRGRDPYPEPDTALERVDAYYVAEEGTPVPSRWLGAGARALELDGAVSRDARRALMQGYDPTTGEALVQNPGVERAYGWDLTFSAPKSVSVVWSQAQGTQRADIEHAHNAAVAAAVREVEALAYARRGHGGGAIERDIGIVAGTFQHGAARPVIGDDQQTRVDPQLHTHVQLMNVAQRGDGSWGALGTHDIYRAKLMLGAVYRAELAAQLHKQGYEVERDGRFFRLAAVPQVLEHDFSSRRGEIEQLMRSHGWSGARGAQYATLLSREAKEPLDAEALRGQWRTRANELAPDFRVADIRRQPAERSLNPEALLAALTEHESVFSHLEMRARAYVEAAAIGRNAAHADAVLAALQDQGELIPLVRRDGEPSRDRYFTTRGMQRLESRMMKQAQRLATRSSHPIDAGSRDHALRQVEAQQGFVLSAEQRGAVDYVTGSGGLALVQGPAGTGKSTLLATAAEAWTAQGYRVRGIAPTGKAAASLTEAIPHAVTIDRATRRWLDDEAEQARNHEEILSHRDVLVVDEAGMVGSQTMARLIQAADTAGAQLVLVGDERQLQPVAAGGAFKVLRAECGAYRLTDIRRQRDAFSRDTVRLLSEGQVRDAVDRLQMEGRVHVCDDRKAAVMTAVERWASRYNRGRPEASAMMAGSNVAARDLNAAARAWLRQHGQLSATEYRFEVVDRSGHARPLELAPGDRILFRRNDDRLGVRNGWRATVQAIETERDGRRWLTATADESGNTVRLSPDAAQPVAHQRNARVRPAYRDIEHGYAQTVHTAQGATVDHAVYCVTGAKSAELAYVALSRHRDCVDLVASRDAVNGHQN